jgi:hypothetical protein
MDNIITMPKKKYAKGHWMGIGIALGMVFGTLVFFVADILIGEFGSMFFLGPGAGIAVGVAIGGALEEKYKDQIREMTPEEKKRQQRAVLLGVVLLVLGVVAGLVAFLASL